MRALSIGLLFFALCPATAGADQWGLASPSGIDGMYHGPISAVYGVPCTRVVVQIPVWSSQAGASFFYRFKRGDGSVSAMSYWADNGPTGGTGVKGQPYVRDQLDIGPQGGHVVVDDAFQVVGAPYYPPGSAKPFPPGGGTFATIAHVKQSRVCSAPVHVTK